MDSMKGSTCVKCQAIGLHSLFQFSYPKATQMAVSKRFIYNHIGIYLHQLLYPMLKAIANYNQILNTPQIIKPIK